ncbi:MAG: glycogen/starch/alpha-glucan phosphorylase [Steroidobacteraceae bacterium]
MDPSSLAQTFEHHLIYDQLLTAATASERDRFEALAHSLRDLIGERWLATEQAYEQTHPKRVYYLSMEYLLGRSLRSNLTNLRIEPLVREMLAHRGIELDRLIEAEPDAGLGNGGLGRLAACFMDSLATLQIPAVGYGLRYEYGMFRQEIVDGWQVEHPDNWLRRPDPWEIARHMDAVETRINCTLKFEEGVAHLADHHAATLRAIPYDRPVVGFNGTVVNTLRLWEAASPEYFDLNEFNQGDFFGAVHDKILAENLTRVLYPDDVTSAGRHLRFLQEYFLVACSLADIVRRFRRDGGDWPHLADHVAVQLNDTHPAMAVAELMRILLDGARLGWDQSWEITRSTLAYTNHTLLPEALERWRVELFELALPRQLEIIYEINRRFLTEVRSRFPHDEGRIERMSLIEERPVKAVRMAHLAIVGSHSTNGVSAIHSDLLRTRTLKDFAEMFPERFRNETNGVTPRRWLLIANPELARLLTETIGEDWITDLGRLRALAPLAEDAAFRARFGEVKRIAKARFAAWLKSVHGQTIDPQSLFDCHIKRIHEYKRQLLNVLHIIILYDRLRRDAANPGDPPRTFLFSGKVAPAYTLAKLIIKLINNVANVIDADPVARGRLKVFFLPNYDVTLAERLIPASDVSEQISTAGYEASGTSNMKFMMNGALTVGTRDGATIEMAQAAGEENFFLFGLTAEQVLGSRSWYDPHWHYAHEPETRSALDLIAGNHFSRGEPGIFAPILEALLAHGDYYMHLADLTSYTRTQAEVSRLYLEPEAWTRRAILNIACSGQFSSDRAIAGYAGQIWNATPWAPPVAPPAASRIEVSASRGGVSNETRTAQQTESTQ